MSHSSKICVVISCLLGFFVGMRQADASYVFADPTGFASQATGTSSTYNFQGTGDLSVNVAVKGSNISWGTSTLNFTGAGLSNPAWMGGSRQMFKIEYNGSSDGGPYELAEIEFTFANPLSTSSYMLFTDFDSYEGLAIAAFDGSNNLIPFSDLTLVRVDGEEPTGSTATTPTWSNTNPTQGWTSVSSNTGWVGTSAVSGYLQETTNVSTSNVGTAIRSATAISRLVFYYNAEATDGTGSNSLRFNFAAPAPGTVPEPASASVFSLLFLAGLAAYRRR